MAPKRTLDNAEAESAQPEQKKPRKAFKVGPDNLPDGPWRRKVTKIKKQLIHKAKLKKAYAKIKDSHEKAQPGSAQDGDEEEPEDEDEEEPEPEVQIHPDRVAMLADDEPELPPARNEGRQMKGRKPGYYDKQLQQAERRKAEAEARIEERERRDEERERKVADRQRYRKAMGKAREEKDGKRKLGRESALLLEKVKRLVNEK